MKNAVPPVYRYLPSVLALALLSGCAGLPAPGDEIQAGKEPPPPAAVDAGPFAPLAQRYEKSARAQEKEGNSRRALDSWHIVSSLRPGDTAASGEVSRLEESLAAAADRHFHRGISFLESGSASRARKEFLLALAADPSHAPALDYLKNRLEADTFSYRVAEGDTFEGIAEKIYKDPGLAFLVARTNGLDPGSAPLSGRELILPILEETPEAGPIPPPPPPPMVSVPVVPEELEVSPAQIRLAKATGYLEAGSFQDALAAAAGIPADAPEAAQARAVMDAAYYGDGASLGKKGDFVAALVSFRKVSPGYQDVKEQIAAVQKKIENLAEDHYKAGVQYFVNQKLEQAAMEWERTLELKPDHPNAGKDLAKARKLIEELQKIR